MLEWHMFCSTLFCYQHKNNVIRSLLFMCTSKIRKRRNIIHKNLNIAIKNNTMTNNIFDNTMKNIIYSTIDTLFCINYLCFM